jgi:sec-independent protein translocase protein TatB
MFDIGFSEMAMIAVVALIVLGPERLPKVARQAGEWIGKLRRYVDDVKADINRQMELEELRRVKQDVETAAKALQSSMQSAMGEAHGSLDEIGQSFANAVSGQTKADEPKTDWDRIYAIRRQRERIKDRRIERERELGIKRPRRRLHR